MKNEAKIWEAKASAEDYVAAQKYLTLLFTPQEAKKAGDAAARRPDGRLCCQGPAAGEPNPFAGQGQSACGGGPQEDQKGKETVSRPTGARRWAPGHHPYDRGRLSPDLRQLALGRKVSRRLLSGRSAFCSAGKFRKASQIPPTLARIGRPPWRQIRTVTRSEARRRLRVLTATRRRSQDAANVITPSPAIRNPRFRLPRRAQAGGQRDPQAHRRRRGRYHHSQIQLVQNAQFRLQGVWREPDRGVRSGEISPAPGAQAAAARIAP